MFRLATAPALSGRRRPQLTSVPATRSNARAVAATAPAATADIRIRRFSESDVSEDTYSAIVPGEDLSPADLLKAIVEAFRNIPEFQVRDENDKNFIITLTLKG